MSVTQKKCELIHGATNELIKWARESQADSQTDFEAAQKLVRRLGAHYRGGRAEVGFWVPELVEQEIPAEWIFLEILTPVDDIDFRADEQTIRFHRERVNLVREGEYAWGVIAGMQPGSRDQAGSFYWLKYQDKQGQWRTIVDPLSYSVPFGTRAPAEFYDIDSMQAGRADREYFATLDTRPDPDGLPRVKGPTNLLQIHVNTASAGGTLESLTEIYRRIAAKIEAGEALTLAEHNYIGYDGVQLMPIEPTIEYEAGPLFWVADETAPDAEMIAVTLHRPDMTNWGYDIMTVGSPAPNPTALGSKRPDELIDFIATLHNFPEQPIKVVFDIVYGHADNQALPLLNQHYFAGSNMYGQNLNYRHPVVRAILLEMQWRKSNSGVDGIRVDGAQDFKWWEPETDTLYHDDDYLGLMNDLVQEVAGQQYRPWMIFEDGRPWPRADWELASTYREVTKQFPNVVQWGPLTFAHNTPFVFTFWASKWWRIQEIMAVGSHWITGCANHDTLRRGTQVDPEARVNTYLGDTLSEIFKLAYNNPAANIFTYVASPGVPMDFINATMRAPWSFIRNVDDRYGVKVASEEALFLDWGVNEAHFAPDFAFPRLKALGFTTLDELHRFMHSLDRAVKMTHYDLAAMVDVLQIVEPPLAGPSLSVPVLKQIAKAWMDDVHDYCNVAHWEEELVAERVHFNVATRQFRRERPWLRQNLRPADGEFLDYVHPTDGNVVFFGLRRAPDGSEEILAVMNMEGAPRTLVPTELHIPNLPQTGWEIALVTPGVTVEAANQPVTLRNSDGVVFVRR